MALVHELSTSVQCCFELFGTQSDGVLLTKQDQAVLNDISSILQPVLLRLQKQAVAVAETSELFAEDEQLLGAVVHLRRALQCLQAAVGRCRSTSHWLLRVLSAEAVRGDMQSAIADTAAAVGELLAVAEGTADVGPLQDVSALHSALQSHKVSRHEALEKLGSGLYKHMESATEAEQVVAMLRFVVREAQNLTMRRKHSRASSSSSSRRDSDASDTSRTDQDSKGAASASNNNNNAAAAASSSMDTGSSSSDGGGSSSSGTHKNNNSGASSSKAGASSSSSKGAAALKPSDVPPGETSLTDVQLLLAVQQLVDTKHGTQQLVLHQILSILEELHDQKAHHLKHKSSRRHAAAAAAAAAGGNGGSSGGNAGGPQAGGGANGQLQSVPEGYDDIAIAAVHPDQHNNHNQQPYSNGGGGLGAAAAAMAAGGQPVTYGSAVAAVSGGLEELLWADAWDTAALTQLLELLLQASSAADEEYVEMAAEEDDSNQQQTGRGGSSSSNGKSSSSGGGRRSLWGQMGAAARAALKSPTKPGGKKKNGAAAANGGSSSSGAAAAASEAVQRQRQERSHQLVSSALDVLLHLTPLPADGAADSAFKPLTRPGMTPYRSLALPLMSHCDTVTALSGCVWSSWPDVATKAARLLTILLRSEGAINDAGSVAAAAGFLAAASPAAAFNTFAHDVCSSGGVSGSGWHGLVTLLHSSNLTSAAAAAEAIAAIGACSTSHELCSSLAASQAARALLLLLSKHQLHLGAGGAAAAALHALSDARVRPGMHDLLLSSYTEHVNGTAVPLGQSCVAIMLSSDSLAACRAARLAASLAHGIDWSTAAAATTSGSSSGGAAGSLWAETFRAGQHVLQRSRSSSSGAEEGSPTVAGALLLRELVLRGCTQQGAGAGADAAATAGADGTPTTDADTLARAREDMCLELLALVVRKLQSYGVGRAGKEGQVAALLQLLSALVSRLSEGAVCGALPDLFGVVVPLLEALQRKGAAAAAAPATNSGVSLQQAAQRLHEQLMVLGG